MAIMEQMAAAGRKRDAGGEERKDGEKGGFKNKQRLLVIASRGITHRFRHLMNDVMKLLPHSTKDAKVSSGPAHRSRAMTLRGPWGTHSDQRPRGSPLRACAGGKAAVRPSPEADRRGGARADGEQGPAVGDQRDLRVARVQLGALL